MTTSTPGPALESKLKRQYAITAHRQSHPASAGDVVGIDASNGIGGQLIGGEMVPLGMSGEGAYMGGDISGLQQAGALVGARLLGGAPGRRKVGAKRLKSSADAIMEAIKSGRIDLNQCLGGGVKKRKGRGNGTEKQKEQAKSNTWLIHLSKFYAANKDKMSYADAMKAARATYTPRPKALKIPKVSRAKK